MRSENLAAAYSHVFNPSWLLNANGWWRQDRVDYHPSAAVFSDQPATFSQHRTLVNFGARADCRLSETTTLWKLDSLRNGRLCRNFSPPG